MTQIITKTIVGILFCLLILFSLKPIIQTDKKIEFSKWGKISAAYFCVSFYAGLMYMYYQDRLPFEISIASIFTFTFPLYVLYATLSFKYEFNETSIIWFNGLYQRKILIGDLLSVKLIKNKNKITRIEFVTQKTIKRMRNDIGIEDSISRIIRKKGIPVNE